MSALIQNSQKFPKNVVCISVLHPRSKFHLFLHMVHTSINAVHPRPAPKILVGMEVGADVGADVGAEGGMEVEVEVEVEVGVTTVQPTRRLPRLPV